MGTWERIKAWFRGIEVAHTLLWLGESAIDKSPYWAGPALAVFAPLVEENMKWTYAIPAGAVLTAALLWIVDGIRQRRVIELGKEITITSETERKDQDSKPALSQADGASLNFIKNRDVTLHELLVREFRVVGRTFEDCVIHGPAIVTFLRTPLIECEFVGPSRDSILFPIWPRRPVVGLTLIKDCTFRHCTFVNIGLAGLQEPQAEFPQASEGRT